MAKRGRKPRLRPFSYMLLCTIDEYIRKHDLRGRALESAGPDVLDGWVVFCEVEELVRKGWLKIVGRAFDGDALCGEIFRESWTATLTQRAIERVWADRAAEPAKSMRGVKRRAAGQCVRQSV